MLSVDQARQIWRYEPETGKFFWLVSPKYDVPAGNNAGWFDGRYNRLTYKGKHYKSARVAWLMMTGQWPSEQIDHINLVKTDDRFSNLREATNSQNLCNINVRLDNKLRIKGVYKGRYSYIAQVWVGGKNKYLGSFKTAEDAKLAHNEAAATLHGEYANTGEKIESSP